MNIQSRLLWMLDWFFPFRNHPILSVRGFGFAVTAIVVVLGAVFWAVFLSMIIRDRIADTAIFSCLAMAAAYFGLQKYLVRGSLTLQFVFGAIFALSTIFLFALVFSELGIVNDAGETVYGMANGTCIYFSMVTFTTLGYGDFSPSENARLAAGTEAMLGLMYFGWIIGIVISRLSDSGEADARLVQPHWWANRDLTRRARMRRRKPRL